MDAESDDLPFAVPEGIGENAVRVRAAREAARLTVFELAERTGIPAHRIASFEGGRTFPTAKEAQALGQATGIPPELFIV
jgi:transcriptional regulator with XRE-family HTH domain